MLTLCLSLLLLITNNSNNSQITDKKEKVMKFELIQLPYAANALEPVSYTHLTLPTKLEV